MFFPRLTRVVISENGVNFGQLIRGSLQMPTTLKLTKLTLPNQARFIHHTQTLLGERRFRDTHEWIEVDGNIGTIGLSHFAADMLSHVVYVELPEVNKEVEKDDEVSCVESTKAVSPIFAPVSGKIVEVNKDLEAKPEAIGMKPAETWIYKMEIKDMEEVKRLMTENEYNQFLDYSKLNDPERRVS